MIPSGGDRNPVERLAEDFAERYRYYAMQFIRGEGLDRVLHDLAGGRDRPRTGPAAGVVRPPAPRDHRLPCPPRLAPAGGMGHSPPPGTASWPCDDRPRLSARSDLQGHIRLWRVKTNEEIASLDGFPGETGLRFSPDGRFLLCWQNQQRRVWDLAGSPPPLVIEEKSSAGGPAFHPDGRRLVLTRIDGSILLCDLTSTHQPPRLLAKGASKNNFQGCGAAVSAAQQAGRLHHKNLFFDAPQARRWPYRPSVSRSARGQAGGGCIRQPCRPLHRSATRDGAANRPAAPPEKRQ
jgi:hypothetical protein